jgi:formimidoylglutamase
MAERIKWCLIGIPDHLGVENVGGRVGAASGPFAFNQAFARLRGRDRVRESLAESVDTGPMSRDIGQNHRRAAEAIRRAHGRVPLSVVIGGGNDHSFTQLLGVRRALELKHSKGFRLGCINIDAHFDVRSSKPVVTSGSPFYMAIEEGVLDPKRFIEFGIQRHCNAPELWQYVEKKKIEVVPFESLRHGKAAPAFARALKKLAVRSDAIVVSLDLDAIQSSDAPGVSAPQAEGFSPTDILEMMAIAGREKKVRSLGIFELNPEHDVDSRTARMAATAAWHFISYALKRSARS